MSIQEKMTKYLFIVLLNTIYKNKIDHRRNDAVQIN